MKNILDDEMTLAFGIFVIGMVILILEIFF